MVVSMFIIIIELIVVQIVCPFAAAGGIGGGRGGDLFDETWASIAHLPNARQLKNFEKIVPKKQPLKKEEEGENYEKVEKDNNNNIRWTANGAIKAEKEMIKAEKKTMEPTFYEKEHRPLPLPMIKQEKESDELGGVEIDAGEQSDNATGSDQKAFDHSNEKKFENHGKIGVVSKFKKLKIAKNKKPKQPLSVRDKICKRTKQIGIRKAAPKMDDTAIKMALVEKYEEIKKELKNKFNYGREIKVKVETDIARALGTSRNFIYKWKHEFGRIKKPKMENNESKIRIVQQFDQMRKEYKRKNRHRNVPETKMETELANELGTNRANIYKWKRELDLRQKPTEKDEATKLALLNEYENIKKKNVNTKNGREKAESEIAKHLAVGETTLYLWKKEFEATKRLSTEEKWEIIDQFEDLRAQFSAKFNTKATYRISVKIARKFGVTMSIINQWKRAIGYIPK